MVEGQLLVYLVKNGYLSDSYHMYISNFHEGRLTKDDRDFLFTIRNFDKPEPNQTIDTPKEVFANMRAEDFGHKYVLNVTLMDYLLESSSEHSNRIENAMRYISEHFTDAEPFFTAYFISGKNLDSFFLTLCKAWPELSKAAVTSTLAAEIVCYILRYIDAKHIANRMNDGELFSDYLAEKGHLVFASNIQAPDNYDVLKTLNVRFRTLPLLAKNSLLLEYIHENSLYTISSENINYLLQKFPKTPVADSSSLEKANYTSIDAVGSDDLKGYINENLADYIANVFLVLPENSKESEAAILSLINKEEIQNERKEEIVLKQEHVFETFGGVPEELWASLVEHGKVSVSWRNISAYLDAEGTENMLVNEIINDPQNIVILSAQEISNKELGEEPSQSVSWFLLNNDEISDIDYCKLIKCVPYVYSEFPDDVSSEKRSCLAREKKVLLSEKSFANAADDHDLIATLIEKNFDKYVADKENYPIENEIRELLLSRDLNQEYKIEICRDVTYQGESIGEVLSSSMVDVLRRDGVDCSEIDNQVLSTVIINAKAMDHSIELFIKCLPNWDETLTTEVLSQLKESYSKIASPGQQFTLDDSSLNARFFEILKTQGFISKVRKTANGLKIDTRKLTDFSEEDQAD